MAPRDEDYVTDAMTDHRLATVMTRLIDRPVVEWLRQKGDRMALFGFGATLSAAETAI